MGAHQSAGMTRAKKLIEGGMSAYKAAAECGITRSAIYMSDWWKARKAKGKKSVRK